MHFNSVDNTGFKRALVTLDRALAVETGEAAIPLVSEDDASSSSSATNSSHGLRQRNALSGEDWDSNENMDSEEEDVDNGMAEHVVLYFF